MKITIYHGSNKIIGKPIYGVGKPYNDYGLGFYCTKHLELAKEWSCIENVDGYVNQYEIELNDLNILNLSNQEYTVLHWLAILVEYRDFVVKSPIMNRAKSWLKNKFKIDLEPYDVIIGYRADDSYFAFAKAFLNNEISLKQLSYAMHLGNLGEQIVLKSKRAFDCIQFQSYEFVDNKEYYPKRLARDRQARTAFFKELEKEDLNGIFIRDLMREDVNANDPRL